jgi:hypothetical protein
MRSHALIEGGVRISQAGSDGAQVVLRFIGPGEIFRTSASWNRNPWPDRG